MLYNDLKQLTRNESAREWTREREREWEGIEPPMNPIDVWTLHRYCYSSNSREKKKKANKNKNLPHFFCNATRLNIYFFHSIWWNSFQFQQQFFRAKQYSVHFLYHSIPLSFSYCFLVFCFDRILVLSIEFLLCLLMKRRTSSVGISILFLFSIWILHLNETNPFFFLNIPSQQQQKNHFNR